MFRRTMFASLAATLAVALPAQGCFDTALGTDLMLGDDDTAQGLALGFTFNFGGVAYTDICVCSNGYIWLGPTSLAGGDYTPTEAELLNGAPRICPLWTDFNPSAAGGGHVYFDNSTPGIAKVTWAGVYEYGGTNPVEVQVVLDASSNITITYGPNAAIGGSLSANVIIGASPGGGAASNPVSFATLPVTITQDTFADVQPTGAPISISNLQMIWTPTMPGYIAAANSCTMNPLPGPAYSENVGAGCPPFQGSALYETFGAGSTVDLSGLDLTFLPTGTDYVVLPGISPTYFTGYTNQLTLADDQTVQVPLPFAFPYNGATVNAVWVSSNGFITLGATDPGSGCCTGAPAALLAGDPRIAAWWADLNPSAGGAIYADLDPVSGEFVISFDQVPEFNQNNAQTCQIALSPIGDFTLRWSNVSTATHTFLTGYSGGNGSPDPGSQDLSAVNGTLVSNTVILPLAHSASAGSTPQVGGTFSLDVSNIAPTPNGNVVVLFVSTESAVPLPLDGLGMTGCTAYINLPALYAPLNLTAGQATTTFSVPIAANPSLYGMQLMSQAISDDLTANAFGFIASNGVRWTLGL